MSRRMASMYLLPPPAKMPEQTSFIRTFLLFDATTTGLSLNRYHVVNRYSSLLTPFPGVRNSRGRDWMMA